MRTIEVAEILGIAPTNVVRLAYRLGLGAPIGSGAQHTWSPGDALAMQILVAISEGKGTGPGRAIGDVYAEGAVKCGEAIDNGYRAAYLVTRGGTENVVVLESENPAATDEMVAALLLQASDAGAAVRVVKLRRMIARLGPWLNELVDA